MNERMKKFNQRRGASIMIALVIFLLCALAGASAFFMAASNAGRYSHTSEQEYYSVSSAALMIVDMLDGLTYTSKDVNYDYERKWNYEGGEHTSSDKYTLKIPQLPFPETAQTSGAGEMSHATTLRTYNGSKGTPLKLCDTIRAQCDKLVPFLNVPDEWYEKVKGTDGAPTKPESVESVSYRFSFEVKNDDKFGKVNGMLVMNANYDLVFTFNSENSEYAITVYWEADVKPVQATGNPTYVYAEGTAIDEDGNYTSGTMTQKRTLSVTVEWDRKNTTISRGEVITNG